MPFFWSKNGAKKIKGARAPFGFPYLGKVAGQDLYADPELLEHKQKGKKASITERVMATDNDPFTPLTQKVFPRKSQHPAVQNLENKLSRLSSNLPDRDFDNEALEFKATLIRANQQGINTKPYIKRYNRICDQRG